MLISKPYGQTKKTRFRGPGSRPTPSRKFVDLVEQALRAQDPIATRITSDYITSSSDNFNAIANGRQDIFQVYRLHTGALNGLNSGLANQSLANQFCALYNLANLSASDRDRTIHFIDVQCETRFTNMANTTLDLEFWFVHPRRDTPAGGMSDAGTPSASALRTDYGTIISESLKASADLALPGLSDTYPTRFDIGVTPYDARMFCQSFKLGRPFRRQLLPGASFDLRHGVELDMDISISDFFDNTALGGTAMAVDSYLYVDLQNVTYGLMCKMSAAHVSSYQAIPIIPDTFIDGSGESNHPPPGDPGVSINPIAPAFANLTDPAQTVRQGSGKLGWKTVARWRYHPTGATGLTAPYVSISADSSAQTALSNEAVMAPFTGRPTPVQYS